MSRHVAYALLVTALWAAVTGCGVNNPFGKKPGTDPRKPIDMPVVGGVKAAPVSFGDEGPRTSSLYRMGDGTWGVAYGSEKFGNKHIYFSTSRDGATWSAAQPVRPGDLSDTDPALFADQTGFHVIFASNREVPTWALYVSDYQGGTWSPPQRLNLPGRMPTEPCVAPTSHGWALAYRATDGLIVAESGDGHNWYEARVAATHLGDPAIAQVDGKLMVVAHRSAQLFELSKTDEFTWSQPKLLPLTGEAQQPALGVDEAGKPVVAFTLRASNSDADPTQIALTTRAADGYWAAPETLTSGSDDNMNPSLQIAPGGARSLAWGIYRSASVRGIVFASLAASPAMTGQFARPSVPNKTAGGTRL